MITTTEKTDAEIKSDVLAELKYEPSVLVTDIGVLVKDGAVTLNGYVTNYGEKWDAVRAAKRVSGVRAIADDINVKMSDSLCRTDGDIAAAAANRIDWITSIPKGTVQMTVTEGRIQLEGQLEWWYQKDAAENAVRYLTGVKGVANLITIKPKLAAEDIKEAITEAFGRNAVLDAKEIHVQTSGTAVSLSGEVCNNAERDEAERVAWAAPGVSLVENRLTVEWSAGED